MVADNSLHQGAAPRSRQAKSVAVKVEDAVGGNGVEQCVDKKVKKRVQKKHRAEKAQRLRDLGVPKARRPYALFTQDFLKQAKDRGDVFSSKEDRFQKAKGAWHVLGEPQQEGYKQKSREEFSAKRAKMFSLGLPAPGPREIEMLDREADEEIGKKAATATTTMTFGTGFRVRDVDFVRLRQLRDSIPGRAHRYRTARRRQDLRQPGQGR